MDSLRHAPPDHDTRDWHWFHRGPTIAADGGRREAEADEADRMRDVEHTPDGDGHANRVWDGTRVREADDVDE